LITATRAESSATSRLRLSATPPSTVDSGDHFVRTSTRSTANTNADAVTQISGARRRRVAVDIGGVDIA